MIKVDIYLDLNLRHENLAADLPTQFRPDLFMCTHVLIESNVMNNNVAHVL